MIHPKHLFNHGTFTGVLLGWIAVTCAGCSSSPDHISETTKAPNLSPLPIATQLSPSPTSTITPTPTTVPASATQTPTPTTSIVAPGVPFDWFRMTSSLEGWALEQFKNPENLWHTQDGGLTWTDVLPQTMEICRIWRGSFKQPLEAWVGVCGLPDQAAGLAKTTDGGKTWTLINSSVEWYDDSSLRVFDSREGILSWYGIGAGSYTERLQETHDGGVTWAPVPIVSLYNGMAPRFPGEVIVSGINGDSIYFDPDRLITVGGNLVMTPSETFGLSITTNRGEEWKNIELPLPSGPFERSWIDSYSPVFYSDTNGILPVYLQVENHKRDAVAFYGTSDGGLSWTFRSLVENTNEVWIDLGSLEFVSDQDIFVCCGKNLCVSHDGAHSWQRLSSNLNFGDSEADNYAGWLDFGDAMTGWTFVETNEDERTLWRTTDGGLSWQELTPEIIGPE